MIDESIMEKIIPLPDEDEEMEKVQGELEGEGFPITNFKKGGIFYHLCRMLVTIYIELKELARTIVNGCFIKHAEGDWLKIKAADYSKQQKEAKAARGYVSIYRSEYNNALQVTKGHCFKTEPDAGGNELKFYCCENTVIDAGEPVGRVLVEAEATGTYYNIAPGRITISMIHLDGVDYVTNDDDWLFEEGAEEEDLEDLRDRCMSSWAELATRTIEGICDELGLFINPKKTQIVKLSHGFTFLKIKYNLTETGKVQERISKDSVTRMRRKLKKFRKLMDAGEMSFDDVRCAYASWKGGVSHYDSYNVVKSMDKLFDELFIHPFIGGGHRDEQNNNEQK